MKKESGQISVGLIMPLLFVVATFIAYYMAIGNAAQAAQAVERLIPRGKKASVGKWMLKRKAPGLTDVQTDISHAVERHGHDITHKTRECLDKEGPDLTMVNPKTNHWAELCEVEPGRWGIRISKQIKGIFQEITVIEYEGNLWDVELYLNRGCYMTCSH